MPPREMTHRNVLHKQPTQDHVNVRPQHSYYSRPRSYRRPVCRITWGPRERTRVQEDETWLISDTYQHSPDHLLTEQDPLPTAQPSEGQKSSNKTVQKVRFDQHHHDDTEDAFSTSKRSRPSSTWSVRTRWPSSRDKAAVEHDRSRIAMVSDSDPSPIARNQVDTGFVYTPMQPYKSVWRENNCPIDSSDTVSPLISYQNKPQGPATCHESQVQSQSQPFSIDPDFSRALRYAIVGLGGY